MPWSNDGAEGQACLLRIRGFADVLCIVHDIADTIATLVIAESDVDLYF